MNCVHCQTTTECRLLWDGRYHCDACLRQIFRTIDPANIKSLLSGVFEEQTETKSPFNTSINIACVVLGFFLAIPLFALDDLVVVGFLLSALLLVVGLILYWNSSRPRKKSWEKVVIGNGVVSYTRDGTQSSHSLGECTWYIGGLPSRQPPTYASTDRGKNSQVVNIITPDRVIIPCGFSNRSFIELCCVLTASDVGKKHDDTWWYGMFYIPAMILAAILGYGLLGVGMVVALSIFDKHLVEETLKGAAVVSFIVLSIWGFVMGCVIVSSRRSSCRIPNELLVGFFFVQIAAMIGGAGLMIVLITNWTLAISCSLFLAAIGTLLLAIFGWSRSELPDGVHDKSLFIEALVSKYVKERT